MKVIFLKVVCLLIVIVGIAILFVGFFMLRFKNLPSEEAPGVINNRLNYAELIDGESMDISEAPISKLVADDYNELFYLDKNRKRKVTHNGHPTSRFYFSPVKDKFGYLENFDIYDKNVPYDQEVVLHIGDAKTRETKNVYHGSFRTSGWEWFSDSEVLVSYGCGTECQTLYIINVDTDKKYTLGYGVGYEWSLNKKMVLAYRYSGRFGIIVGDKFGNILFQLSRESPDIYSELLSQTKAAWSPDSNKIAAVIKKEDQDQLELLVFDTQENFKQIFQSDVDFFKDVELRWDSDEKLIYNDLKFVLKK